MASAVAFPETRDQIKRVPFRFDGCRKPAARRVSLVGPFNRWDASEHPLALQPDGRWTISVNLPPGEYPYLFVVDGAPWNDLEDDGRAPCEWGGEYSIRVVR